MSGSAKKTPVRRGGPDSPAVPPGSGGKGRRRSNAPAAPEWSLCPESGFWRHRDAAEAHREWMESGAQEGALTTHVVAKGDGDEAGGGFLLGPLGKVHVGDDDRPPHKLSRLSRRAFLPECLMGVAGIGFGDLVVVERPEGHRIVVRALPLPASRGLSLSKDLFIRSVDDEGATARIRCPKKNFNPATKIVLKLEEDSAGEDRQALEVCVRSVLEDQVVVEGEELAVDFYGRTARMRVKDLSTMGGGGNDDVDTLASDLKNVRLNVEADSGLIAGVVTCATIITLVTEEDETNVDHEHPEEHSLQHVGGLDPEVEKLTKYLKPILFPAKTSDSAHTSHGVLIWGPPGVGKTLLGGELIGPRLGARVVKVAASDVVSKFYGEAEEKLRKIFDQAEEEGGPALIFLDEVDALCGGGAKPEGNASSGQEVRLAAVLVSLLDGLRRRASRVAVMAATSRLAAVDNRLRSPGRLDNEVEVAVPTVERRRDILRGILKQSGDEFGKVCEETLCEIASACHGFVGADLRGMVAAAARSEDAGSTTVEDRLRSAAKSTKPSAMKEVLVEVPSVTWEDIGGLEELKLSLRQAVTWPLERPEAFRRMGIRPPRGVLMYGPPGCSKTMVAKALANESGVNFLSVKGPELFSKWVGESERAVRELFRRARQVAPAVVFFDEIDALGSERGSGSGGGGDVGNRVLAQLLTEMDGVERLGQVTVVAATNRPDLIDRALMRPGRLDRQFYVPLPDAETRRKVLEVHTRGRPLAVDVEVDEVVLATEGYSGAEVAAVCNEAGYAALEDSLEEDSGHGEEAVKKRQIEMRHFRRALGAVTPRIKSDLLELYKNFQSRGK